MELAANIISICISNPEMEDLDKLCRFYDIKNIENIRNKPEYINILHNELTTKLKIFPDTFNASKALEHINHSYNEVMKDIGQKIIRKYSPTFKNLDEIQPIDHSFNKEICEEKVIVPT